MIKKVFILDKAREKVQFWVNQADIEVSGFGTAYYDKELDSIVVTDAWVLKQKTAGAAHTEIDGEALAALSEEVAAIDPRLELRWWWHSHVNMQAFWSGTDTTTIKELGANGWISATVFNKRGETRSAVCVKTTRTDETDFGKVVTRDVVLEDNATTYYEEHKDARHEQWKKELDDAMPKKSFLNSGVMDGGRVPKIQSKTTMLNMTRDEWDWILATDPGYMGYGLAEEARALGVPVTMYYENLERGDKGMLAYYEEQLERKVKKGKLKYKGEVHGEVRHGNSTDYEGKQTSFIAPV